MCPEQGELIGDLLHTSIGEVPWRLMNAVVLRFNYAQDSGRRLRLLSLNFHPVLSPTYGGYPSSPLLH
jgi:hypothetical protein